MKDKMLDFLEKILFPFDNSYLSALYQAIILWILALLIGLFLGIKYDFPNWTGSLIWVVLLLLWAYFLDKIFK